MDCPFGPAFTRQRAVDVLHHAGNEFDKDRFAVDPRSAPQRVFAAHAADQGADVAWDRWASASAPPRLPRPVQSEAFSMPADDGFRLHDHQHFTPVWQEPRVGAPRAGDPSAAAKAAARFSSSRRADAEEQRVQTGALRVHGSCRGVLKEGEERRSRTCRGRYPVPVRNATVSRADGVFRRHRV